MARRRRPAEPEPPSEPEEEGQAEAPNPARRLTSRHRATLEAIFETPTRADIPWRSIEALFEALGGEVAPGRGSRRRVALLGARAVFHEPHPEKVADKGAIKDVRDFLARVGVEP